MVSLSIGQSKSSKEMLKGFSIKIFVAKSASSECVSSEDLLS